VSGWWIVDRQDPPGARFKRSLSGFLAVGCRDTEPPGPFQPLAANGYLVITFIIMSFEGQNPVEGRDVDPDQGRVMKTKLRRIGSGYGVLLPKKVIDNLRLSVGAELELTEHEWGLDLSPFDPDFADQVEAFRRTEGQHRNSYRELGK